MLISIQRAGATDLQADSDSLTRLSEWSRQLEFQRVKVSMGWIGQSMSLLSLTRRSLCNLVSFPDEVELSSKMKLSCKINLNLRSASKRGTKEFIHATAYEL